MNNNNFKSIKILYQSEKYKITGTFRHGINNVIIDLFRWSDKNEKWELWHTSINQIWNYTYETFKVIKLLNGENNE